MEAYGFDASWSDERRRLALIERCYDPITTARLTQLGVAEGWRCLDVGAGGGSISRWLRDQVGPDGEVVAVDLDTRFFEDEPGSRLVGATSWPTRSSQKPSTSSTAGCCFTTCATISSRP